MNALSGKTSDRIRAGEPLAMYLKYQRQPEFPCIVLIIHGEGHGLGQGATEARHGKPEDRAE